MAKKTDKKTFYSVEVALWDGSQFDADEDVKYYGDYIDADDAFDRAIKDMYHKFEIGYDSAEILVYEEKMIDGTRVCTINGENIANEKDTCKVRLKELTMN